MPTAGVARLLRAHSSSPTKGAWDFVMFIGLGSHNSLLKLTRAIVSPHVAALMIPLAGILKESL